MDKDREKVGDVDAGYSFDADHGNVGNVTNGTKMSRFVDSFKRNPNARMLTEDVDADGKPIDVGPVEPALSMSLKPRHLQMIAIGGSIGIPRSLTSCAWHQSWVLLSHAHSRDIFCST